MKGIRKDKETIMKASKAEKAVNNSARNGPIVEPALGELRTGPWQPKIRDKILEVSHSITH